jgi:hypothetical protein
VWWNSSVVIPKLNPARNASVFALPTGSSPNLAWIHSKTGSVGRLNIQEMRPRAKKFLERSTARPVTPVSITAILVSCSIGAVRRWTPRRLPSSSGFVS